MSSKRHATTTQSRCRLVASCGRESEKKTVTGTKGVDWSTVRRRVKSSGLQIM